jgi:hypothetical protein
MSNTPGADINEIWCGYALNGYVWDGGMSGAKDTYDLRRSTVNIDEIRWRKGQAEVMANEIRNFARTNGYTFPIVNVHWTARSDFSFTNLDSRWEEKSKDHPADLLIEFSDSVYSGGPSGNFLGVSLKSLQANTGKAPVKNPGAGKIADFINKPGVFDGILNKYLEEVKNKGLFVVKQKYLDDNNVKKYWKPKDQKAKNTEHYKILDENKNKCLAECCDKLIKGFESLDEGEVRLYILSDLLDTDKLPQYIKVTGYGKQKYRASYDIPTGQNNKTFKALMNMRKTMSYKKTSDGDSFSFIVKVGQQKIIRVRWKFAERPFSSGLKMSIELA